jgi:hypothetical protein
LNCGVFLVFLVHFQIECDLLFATVSDVQQQRSLSYAIEGSLL